MSLDRALRQARREVTRPLDAVHRYVIFSDHHKGARNEADDFRQCEATYLKALNYYYERDFQLIVLGDAEELWEENIATVLGAYGNVLQSEARFHPDRYVRIWGNHDDPWSDDEQVRKYLDPIFPGIQFHEGLIFEVYEGGRVIGDLFLVHGHQGTLDSEFFAFLGPKFLPLYRDFQNLTGFGRTSPSKDACLRAEHDTHMYRWSSKKEKLILIAGHTHRPVWSSRTHLEKLLIELQKFLEQQGQMPPDEFEKELQKKIRKIKIRKQKYPPCTDTIKTQPSYFNAGCCRFEDGDITGIELEKGQIRLIKWSNAADEQEPLILEQSPLKNIFSLLMT
jgi:hypothetical protein